MARAQGARALMALAFETTYGTPPVSGFTRMPFASTSLGAEQPLLNSELLGYGRDPLAPIKDAVTADGDVVVPLDAEAFGFWLKAAFGAPTTTGAEAPTATSSSRGPGRCPACRSRPACPRCRAMRCIPAACSTRSPGRCSGRAADRDGAAGGAGRDGRHDDQRRDARRARIEALRPFQRGDHPERLRPRQRGLGRHHLCQQPRPDRDHPLDGRIDGADPSIAALTGSIEVRFADRRW
jgi:hypothetical protein